MKKIKNGNNLLAINKLLHLYVEVSSNMVKDLIPESNWNNLYFSLTLRENKIKNYKSLNISLVQKDKDKDKDKDKSLNMIPFNKPGLSDELNLRFAEMVSDEANLDKKVSSLNIGATDIFNGDLNIKNNYLDDLTGCALSVELFARFAKQAKEKDLVKYLSLIESDNYDFPQISNLAEKYSRTGTLSNSAKTFFSNPQGVFFKKLETEQKVNTFFGSLMESAILYNGNSKDCNSYKMNDIFDFLYDIKDYISNEYKNEVLVNAFMSSSEIKNRQVLSFAEKFIGANNFTHPKLIEAKKLFDKKTNVELIKEVDVSSLVFLNPDISAFSIIKYGTIWSASNEIKVNSVKKEDIYDLILMTTGLLQNAGFKDKLGINDIKKVKLPCLGTTLVLDIDKDNFNLEFYKNTINEVMPIITENTLKDNPIGTFISYVNNHNAIENIKPYVLKHVIGDIMDKEVNNSHNDNDSSDVGFKL